MVMAQRRLAAVRPSAIQEDDTAPSAPAGVSDFLDVIDVVVTNDADTNEELLMFEAPRDKNWEDSTGTRIKRLALVYGYWLIQNFPKVNVAFRARDLPQDMADEDFPSPIIFQDDPSTGNPILWAPPWVSSPFAPGAAGAADPDINTRSAIVCRKMRDFKNRPSGPLRRFGQWARSRAGFLCGVVCAGFLGAAAFILVGGGEWVTGIIYGRGTKEIPGTDTPTKCADGTTCTSKRYQLPDGSDCLLNCCTGKYEDCKKGPTDLTDLLLIGLVGAGALAILLAALSQLDKKKKR